MKHTLSKADQVGFNLEQKLADSIFKKLNNDEEIESAFYCVFMAISGRMALNYPKSDLIEFVSRAHDISMETEGIPLEPLTDDVVVSNLEKKNEELKMQIKEILSIIQEHAEGGNLENFRFLSEKLELYENIDESKQDERILN